MADDVMNNNEECVLNHPRNWRMRPLARAVVSSSCFFMLFPSVAIAAPAASALPQAAANWLQAGSATNSTVGNTMTINQGSNKAILNWNNFNIGKDAKVVFVQPGVDAIALNKIGGNSASEIFGVLGANGTIYLINNNGILFGAGSQVNVHGLLASTLNIDDAKFMSTALSQFVNDGSAALSGGTAANAAVVVENGAKIQTDSGGQVLMFAPSVINGGDISTPDGQTILAASKDRVYLAVSDNDVNLRGLLVEVATGGDVKNVGSIVAERGNITLLGLAVNQEGRLRATTSVDVNGTIRLLARDGATVQTNDSSIDAKALLLIDPTLDPKSGLPLSTTKLAVPTHTGTVTVKAGSVTEVVADTALDSSGKVKTAADAQTQSKSRIDIVGKTINIEDNSTLSAKSGRINVTATVTPDKYISDTVQSDLRQNDARVYVGKNATIDVSGEDVLLPMSRRVVAVELRGDELKDSPLQRDGVLRGQTVYVDIDKGSPLISDLAPTLAKIQRDVKERSTSAGSINLFSQGDVVLSQGATLNISGGSVNYESGLVNTTKLLSNGIIVDIGSADPNRHYDGIFGTHVETHPKWGAATYGQNSFLTRGIWRDGFTEGQDAGSLNIAAPALYGFDLANLQAGVKIGVNQRSAPPAGGAVTITLGKNIGAEASATIQDVLIDQYVNSMGWNVDSVLPTVSTTAATAGRAQTLNISADQLNRSGVGSFTVDAVGAVRVSESADIALMSGAKITLKGDAIAIDGRIQAPAGEINLQTQSPAWITNDGNFSVALGNNSLLSTSARWINDIKDGAASTAAQLINGGKIKIDALGDLLMASGAQIHADAGAKLSSAGVFTGGNGGSITLTTRARSLADSGSKLALSNNLSAFGFGTGGALTLTANAFQIGGVQPTDSSLNAVLLSPDFFSSGGFSSYAINSNRGGVDVAANTVVNLQQKNWVVGSLKTAAEQASAINAQSISETVLVPVWQRKPVSLTLSTADTVATHKENIKPHNLLIETGAVIRGEPGASVALTSDRSIYVDGEISTPGGSIDLTLNPPADAQYTGFDATQSIWLGSHARLSAVATQVLQDSTAGLRLGTVFNGGEIKLTANRGAVIAEPNSVIDVSGASFTQDIAASGGRYKRQTVNASAGSIELTGAEGLLVYSNLYGRASGDGYGGTLAYRLDANNRGIQDTDSSYAAHLETRELRVSENLPTWNSNFKFGQALASSLIGVGYVSAASVRNGGFSHLELSAANNYNQVTFRNYGSIRFTSDLSLALSDTLVLDSVNLALDNHSVSLFAPTILIGEQQTNNPFLQQIASTPSGSGNFYLNGQFIELLGNIGISGASDIQLSSANDIRVRSVYIPALQDRSFRQGVFTTPGNLTLSASQIYPATLSDYLFNLTGSNSVFTTANSGNARSPVLSAGGILRVNAPIIEHGGTLLAPLGTLELNATQSIHLAGGSVLDVSGNNQLIPFGRLLGEDIAWVYPLLASQPLVIGQTPEKSVNLTAPSVKADAGSQVNLSGGGDIYGIEQVPGPGGSKDFLDAAYANGAFAVIPTLHTPISPYDAVEMNGNNIAVGQIIYLEGGNGLPAGEYAVLPAHYALLSGAYLITPTKTTVAEGTTGQRTDGVPLTSGRYGRAFSAQYDAQWQGFYIEPGSAARTRSEYTEATGNQFFSDKGVDLAQDAGRITLSVRDRLQLDGIINAAAQNGHGAQMDIIADLLDIVAAGSSTTSNNGSVLIDAGALSKVGVDSLLLGATRSRSGDTTAIDVKSSQVNIRAGAVLTAPDLIIAATDRVGVEAGAQIISNGKSSQNYTALQINANNSGSSNGALLRVSSGTQVDVNRAGTVTDASGNLDIATGATIGAKSALFDATGTMRLDGDLALAQDAALNISANRISVGNNIGNVNGVKLSGEKLAALNASTLRLSSRSAIDFYGDVNFANERAELNAGALRAMTPGAVSINATNALQLSNTNNVSPSSVAQNGSTLAISARTLELGSALDKNTTMNLSGFSTVQLGSAGVTNAVVGQGAFTLKTDGALNVIADHIEGTTASNTTLNAVGAIDLATANSGVINNASNALGSVLTIEGSRVALATDIAMPSGVVNLKANGTQMGDAVLLRDGANIDVSGRTLHFAYNDVRSNGGEVHLQSTAGNVEAAAGASVRIGATATDSQGANGGLLDIVASAGHVLWNAVVDGHAGANDSTSDYRGGSLKVDALEIGDTGAWLSRTVSSGIDKLISLRARTGDIAIDQSARAQSIAIAADNGTLTINSTLDASGKAGGSIALNAGNDVNIGGNAQLLATATGDVQRGGNVQIGTRNGALNFANGSRIDVSGNGGRDGSVLLRAPRNNGNSDVAVNNQGVTITGAERIDLEAFRTYNSSTLTNSLMAIAQGDSDIFMANEAAIRARLGAVGADANFHLRPGVEIDSAGDITVSDEINFVALRSGVNAEPGILTLRAAGNVNVSNSLLDGYSDITWSLLSPSLSAFPVLLPGSSWSYRFVAGADTSAASFSTVKDGIGNVVISNGADVITGTGNIEIYAGHDVTVQQASSLIASLGQTKYREYAIDPSLKNNLEQILGVTLNDLESLPDTGDYDAYWLFLIGLHYLQYPEHGGNVTIAAGNDATFAKTDYFFTDWISRIGGTITIDTAGADIAPTYNMTTWGILLDDLANQQGIAVMGGGNLAVTAGRDISNLYATLPVTARQNGNGTNHYEIVGGGNADIVAGRDILSPRIEVDKGQLNLTAGRDISALTGDLNGVFAIADTQVNLQARGDILIDGVINSTVMPQALAQNNGGLFPENYFFTYSDTAALNASSLVGNITLTNRTEDIASAINARLVNPLVGTSGQELSKLFAIYSGSVSLAALQGNLLFQNQTLLFPNAHGNLILNAGENISGVGTQNAKIIVSDVGAESLPWYDRIFDVNQIQPLITQAFANTLHAQTPVHWQDNQSVIVDALSGDIAPKFDDSTLSFQLIVNKSLLANAGRDIVGTDFYIQNNRDSDISVLSAGRDIGFPLSLSSNGTIGVSSHGIRIAGPGNLEIFAGRNIDLGSSTGIESIGNRDNAALTDSGADVSLLAGINGPSALTDPVLYNIFVDRYFSTSDTLATSYIDWFGRGNFSGDSATLLSVFTGSNYSDKAAAIAAFNALPVLTQQAISLQAWQIQQNGSRSHAANLVDFVSFERFNGDLAAAMNTLTNPAHAYTSNAEAAAALALLPAAQQQQIALRAFNSSATIQRQPLLLAVLFDEVRNGGIENAKGLVVDANNDGFARSRNAIAAMFPGDKWKGDINLVLSAVRTLGDGDINLLAPGGDVNVGLANNIQGVTKESSALGLIAQRYGNINVLVDGDINVNQSRVFSLDGGDISMWSSNGNIDAGRGAKSALSIPPPVVKFDPITGAFKLEFPAAVSGSGIQTAANTRKAATARGALVADTIANSRSDTRTFRQRYFDSIGAGDVYLFAPQGVINAGDAGISVGGNLLLAAQQVLGANNISVGGIAIGVPTTTSVSAGTLSLGDVASSATESATNSMNDAIRDAAAALAESTAAFVTVDIIGVSN